MTKISQREAHRLRKQVASLERALRMLKSTVQSKYAGQLVGTISWNGVSEIASKAQMCFALDHFLIAIPEANDKLTIRCVPVSRIEP